MFQFTQSSRSLSLPVWETRLPSFDGAVPAAFPRSLSDVSLDRTDKRKTRKRFGALAFEEGPPDDRSYGAAASSVELDPLNPSNARSEVEETPSTSQRSRPALLVITTLLGFVSLFTFQAPLVLRVFGRGLSRHFQTSVAVLFVICYASMGYVALCDPGQLSEASFRMMQADGMQLPRRSHMNRQYARPIRRYDHYCRWLANCIGLLNHREFLVMCASLVAFSISGAATDAVLVYNLHRRSEYTVPEILVLLVHFAYSIGLLYFLWPILQLHLGLVSRNELAREWKKSEFYVVRYKFTGEVRPVIELTDAEFNAVFDDLEYDREQNPYDQGTIHNWITFWCTRRWSEGSLGFLGEF